jgi:hypothetical protein
MKRLQYHMDLPFRKKRHSPVFILFKKIAGAVLILLGLILHLIPLFPAGWIIVLGLELLGIRLLLQDKVDGHLNRYKIYRVIKDRLRKK